MESATGWLDAKHCPECGKDFTVLYPHLWGYKLNGKYFCSWGCKRKKEKEAETMEKEKMMVLTDEQKERAVDIALKGGNPLKYLAEIGCKNPTTAWGTVRNWAKKQHWDTDVMSQLPEKFGKKPAKKPEETPALTMAPLPAPVEALEVTMSAEMEGYTSTAIRKSGVGEFYYDREHKTIDWRNEYGEEVSLMPEDWRKLAEEIPKMIRILGLDG